MEKDLLLFKLKVTLFPQLASVVMIYNAVVLCGEDNKPYVQFVDSWKTFNVLPTITELNAHFPSSAEFYIRSYQQNNRYPTRRKGRETFRQSIGVR
ncbi:MAG: T3SS effector cysteine hydrolase SpvD family protein [Candidatus Arsenophonus phytopathogenicus]